MTCYIMNRVGIDIRPLMDPIRTGVGEYVYELLDALFKIDKQNQYFLFYNSSKENVHYIGFGWPNKLFNLSLLILKRPKLDRLTGQKLDYWFSPNISFVSVSKECKHILTIHDLSFEYFPDCFSFKRRLWHKILNPKKACWRADIILTPSENTKQDVINEYKINKDRVKVLYPGLSMKHETHNMKQVVEKYDLPEKFILFLGTLEPRKNIIGIIEAFNASELRTIGYELVIAGVKGWKFKPIMDLIAKSDKVKYIGYVDAEDKPNLYKLAGLFIYPSLYEGFGFPVLEAMSAGTPVITSNRSSLPEVAGDNAYLVNPNNVDEISRGMEFLSKDQATKQHLSTLGLERAGMFNWGKTAEEFLDILETNII